MRPVLNRSFHLSAWYTWSTGWYALPSPDLSLAFPHSYFPPILPATTPFSLQLPSPSHLSNQFSFRANAKRIRSTPASDGKCTEKMEGDWGRNWGSHQKRKGESVHSNIPWIRRKASPPSELQSHSRPQPFPSTLPQSSQPDSGNSHKDKRTGGKSWSPDANSPSESESSAGTGAIQVLSQGPSSTIRS